MERLRKVVAGFFLLLCIQETASRAPVAVESCGSTSVTLSIVTPASDPRGSDVVKYKVDYGTYIFNTTTQYVPRTRGASETMVTIRELTPGTVYMFEVTPVYTDGSEGQSLQIHQQTPHPGQTTTTCGSGSTAFTYSYVITGLHVVISWAVAARMA